MTDSLSIPLTALVDGVEIPSYAYPGDAGMDLRSIESLEIKPFERTLVSTGIAIAIPEGYAGFVQPRSGLAIKQGVTVLNTPGLIDSHYRGELKVALINLDPNNVFQVKPGDRIAQLVIQPISLCTPVEVDELDETERGVGGFGSSGAK